MSEEIDLVIVGSIGIDTIQTPNEIKEEYSVDPQAMHVRQHHFSQIQEWLE